MNDLVPWTEKYRPQTLDQVVGQKQIISSLKQFVKRKDMPNLLFSGAPGVGKTTSAIAMAKELFGEQFKSSFLELNASDERGINIIRGKVKEFARMSAINKVPFKLIFLDEADALTTDAQHALRRTMESYMSVTRFILSCNYVSKIIEPLQSRCAVFKFKSLSEQDIRDMISKICKNEKLTIDEKAIKAIIYVSDGDMRRVINLLQGASLKSKNITEEVIYSISSAARPKEVKEMLDFALKSNFSKAREKLFYLLIDQGEDAQEILSQIYKALVSDKNIADKKRLLLIDKLAEYDFRISEGANPRIQLEALLASFSAIE